MSKVSKHTKLYLNVKLKLYPNVKVSKCQNSVYPNVKSILMSIFSSFDSLFLFLVVCQSEIVEQNRGKRLFLFCPDPGDSDSNALSNKASFCEKT